MHLKMVAAIQNIYVQKQKKKYIKNLIRKYYFKSLQHPLEKNLWSQLYLDGAVGKNAHKAASKYLIGMTGRCCYCQERIFHFANFNIDHVLPREAYPQFTFWPENLAAACITCNAIKSSLDYFNVSVKELNYRRYGKSWQCFHPNFHRYHEHVEMIVFQTNNFYVRAYIGITPQGKELCKNLLAKITEYSVKSSVNKEIDKAILGLQSVMAQSNTNLMPGVEKLIADLINHM